MKEQATCVKDNFDSPSYSLESKMMNNGKEIAYDLGMIRVVEVIVGGFAKGGLNNNACKGHL